MQDCSVSSVTHIMWLLMSEHYSIPDMDSRPYVWLYEIKDKNTFMWVKTRGRCVQYYACKTLPFRGRAPLVFSI